MSLQQHDYDFQVVDPDDRVMTLAEWYAANRISEDTGRRIIARGEIEVIQLSERRKGITRGADKRWKAARTRPVPAA